MAGLKQTAEQAEHRAQEAKKTSQSLKSEVNDLAVQTERLVNSTGQSVRSTVDEVARPFLTISLEISLESLNHLASMTKQQLFSMN